ncbi:MAG: Mut7-C ubiquitin/RNAse domain-containing protein [Spirochaetes bacterium]|nr:Mut7-C ubiquitin/RNAse domain-containing protein [Spirochaetota bacterium]
MESAECNIIIRFYEELNDFLPEYLRKKDFNYSFNSGRSVKDLIKAIGVPHVEVDLILANRAPVDFSYIVQDMDRISVYPVFESLSIRGISPLRERPLRNLNFVLDVHLTKLAKRMRLLGFDVDYKKEKDDAELAYISETEGRILLTRDVQLLKRKNISRGLFIRNTNPEKQITEVMEKLDLWKECRPFHRCINCNGTVNKLSYEDKKQFICSRVPEGVLEWCREYFICGSCGRIYWKGSHYEKLQKIISRIPDYSEKTTDSTLQDTMHPAERFFLLN